MFLTGNKMKYFRFKNKESFKVKERGVTLYIALAVTSAMVLVSFAVINVTVKQLGISSFSRDSQIAFFAADSGVECALYWDLKSGANPFSTSTSPIPSITCHGSTVTQSRNYNGTIATSTFSFSPTPCSSVSVVKRYVGSEIKTKIESRGYNSCSTSNPRRVERAILVNY